MASSGTARAWLSGFGALLMTIFAVVPFAVISLYMQQMAESLNVTIGVISGALSVATIGSILGSLVIGRLLKVLSHRVMILIGAILVSAFQFSLAFADNIILIYVFGFLFGPGTIWAGIAMAQIVINQWFDKGRGTMLSANMIIMSVVMTVMIPVLGTLVAQFGYRQVTMVIGILTLAGIVIAAFVTSGAPQKYGVKPLGAVDASAQTGDGAVAALPPSLSFGKVIKSPVFWAIFVVVVLGTVVAQGFTSQAAVIFVSLGLSPVDAAFAFSILTFLGMPWQFVFGVLSDKIGPKIALTICASVCAVVLLVAFLWTGWVGAIAFAIGLSAGGCISGLYGPNMAPRLFGVKDIGDIIGFVIMGTSVGSTIGPLFFGLTYDAWGNYTITLTICGVIMVLCILINYWLNSKKNLAKIQEQIAAEAEAEANKLSEQAPA